jgi:polyferredoxin
MTTEEKNASLSLAQPHPSGLNSGQKGGIALGLLGFGILLLAFLGAGVNSALFLAIALLAMLSGGIVYGVAAYQGKSAGIKNDGVWFQSLSSRGLIGWSIGVVLTGFYVILYWFPEMLGLGVNGVANTGLVAFFDPLSLILNGKPASQWFVYGTLYTIAILSLGIKFIWKYRHNRYQLIRTVVVIISQVFLAYFIPEILEGLNTGVAYFDKDIKNMWPLNYDFFSDWHLNNMTSSGNYGMFFLVLGIFMFLVFTPIITYFVGKRWYCSWICGCGGLAETAGDSFRHLSSKKVSAWRFERWSIHLVMLLVFIMTAATLYGYFAGTSQVFGLSIYEYFQKPYGFVIGAMFSGVVGVGFYPMLGSRVWCRFGCPLAGYMGIIQRFKSRFRITTNGGQCISCGNCSTYCEQGIDVRAYAQKGQNIVRASCVGCGICSAVCPRGVLKLENGPEKGRITDDPIIIGNDGVRLRSE